ncbi:MAG: hypothetical protein R3C29_03100 [Dehalococcoidia bacterium]
MTEEDPSGLVRHGAHIVDGSGKSPSTTTNAGVMDDSLSSYNDAVVEFGNRETASVRVTKVNDRVGNADRSGWVFTLTGCGILKTASTGASGVILWGEPRALPLYRQGSRCQPGWLHHQPFRPAERKAGTRRDGRGDLHQQPPARDHASAFLDATHQHPDGHAGDANKHAD